MIFKKVCAECLKHFVCAGEGCGLINAPENDRTNECHCPDCTKKHNIENTSKWLFETCPKFFTKEELLLEEL